MNKRRCHNCKFSGPAFKLNNLTHNYCEDPKQYNQEKFNNGEFDPIESLRVFSDSCDKHKFKQTKENGKALTK